MRRSDVIARLRDLLIRAHLWALARLGVMPARKVHVVFDDNLFLDFDPETLVTYDPETNTFTISGFAILPKARMLEMSARYGFEIELGEERTYPITYRC